MIWTVQKFLRQGTKMGLSQPNWAAVWLSLAKNYMPNEFQSLARYSEDPDALFIQLTAAINSEHETCKIRNSLVKVHRKPNEMVQSPLYLVKSNYEMLLAIEYPELEKAQISLRSDFYAASSAHFLVTKPTAEVIKEWVSLRNTSGQPVNLIGVGNLITQHEAQNPGDKISTVLYLPESCSRLDQNATQASIVTELVLATTRLGLDQRYRPRKNTTPTQRTPSKERYYKRSNSRDKHYEGERSRNRYKRSNSRDHKGGSNRYRSSSRDRRQGHRNGWLLLWQIPNTIPK